MVMKGIVDSICKLEFEQGKLLLHLKFKYLIMSNSYNDNLCISVDKEKVLSSKYILIVCYIH
jgi:hypothetical protein